MFSAQRRMLDFDLSQATSWAELTELHAKWFADYNLQSHFAHQDRTDGKHSPYAVLRSALGRPYDLNAIEPLFPLRFHRTVDAQGNMLFQHWKLYAEEALPGKGVLLWTYKELLTISYEGATLIQIHYPTTTTRCSDQIETIEAPTVYRSQFSSPQLQLWELSGVEWHPVRYIKPLPRRRRRQRWGEPYLWDEAVMRATLDEQHQSRTKSL